MFFVFNIFIVIGIIQGYFFRRITMPDLRSKIFILFALILATYLVAFSWISSKAIHIRNSPAGKVCSGEYLTKHD